MDPKPLSVAQARAIDRDAVERLGMPSVLLMENAAAAVAAQVARMGPDGPVVILCGPGNNGGDGLAAARLLGPRCRVHLLAEPDPARAPDAALQLRILRAAGWPIAVGALPDAAAAGDAATVWVDALFGTGLTRPLTGAAAAWVRAFNAARGPRLSVDIPSGLHGDRGEALGPTCRAHATVTFAAAKLGLLAEGARAYTGEIIVAGLGIPEPWPPGAVAQDLDE